jgi:GNAT superfamily N-acetyltransferase
VSGGAGVISARPARPEDASDLDRLGAESRAETREKRGGELSVDELDATHEELGPSDAPPRIVLVGTIDDVVVGYASLARTGRVALVEELYCEPGARGVGVGDALVAEAADLASQWGCAFLDSLVLPGDRETKNFFEAHGMVSRLLRVSRPLRP